MNVHDVATYAGTVVSPAEATPEFLEKVRQQIAVSSPGAGAAAIAWARYGDKLSAEELANPEFLKNLLFASTTYAPASQGKMATELISALSYAREHVDIFEAAEAVAVPGSCTDNEWFASAGVFQLAKMSADSPEWAQIEATLGRSLSKEEREAAIKAGKGLADNWTYLCQNASALNLSLRKGTTDVIDFTDDNLRDANMSPLIALLGSAPATMGGSTMPVLSALEYVRQHMDIYDSAEEFNDSKKKDHDGKFINNGVFQVAGMAADDPNWGKIEAKLGRTLSQEERQLAINAAKGLTDNWAFLCSNAESIGLTLREDTTDIIYFKNDTLDDLNWGVMLPQSGVPLTGDLLNSLEYARAKQLETNLSTDGKFTEGANFDTIIGLSPAQIDKLLALDPKAVKDMLSHGRSLAEIAELTPEQIDNLVEVNDELLNWLLKLADYTLSDIAKLTTENLGGLQEAMRAGVRHAGATEDFADIQVESISSPINLSGGMLIFDTASGQKIMVTKEGNRALYEKVSEMLATRVKADVDKVRAEFKLPPTSATDIMAMPSKTLIDPKDPNSGYLTVGQVTINNLLGKYRGMLERGEMAKDDPRAQALRAFEARSALSNGYSLLPYYESSGHFGSTYRTYPGGEKDPEFSDMSPKEVEALIDPAKVDAQIAELLGNETIQKDYQTALNESLAVLPDKKALADQLQTAITSTDYTDALKALRAKGMSYEAESMTQNDIMALAMLDPARGTEAAQTLALNAVEVDLQTLLEDPSLVDNAVFDQAVDDAIEIFLQATRSVSSLARHGSESTAQYFKYLKNLGKADVTALATGLRQLVIDAKKSGSTLNLSELTDAQWKTVLDNTALPMEAKGKAMTFFAEAQKFGVWGSIGGAATVAAFAYRLHEGAWDKDSTALDRWAAARDIIAFLSVSQHIAKTGAGIVDLYKTMMGTNNANNDAIRTALGLDDALPKIWGRDKSLLPHEMSWRQLFTGYDAVTEAPDTEARRLVQEAAESLGDAFVAKTGLPPMGSAAKIGLTMLKVLGTVTDLVGIADIVVGALGLHKSIAEKDSAGIAANTLSIASGIAITGAGVIGTAQLFASVGALAAASAPLFFVGAVLAAGAFLVTVITAMVKRHNQLQDVSDDQGQWFRDLEKDGVTQAGWGDKLEYLRYAWSIYGNDNTDPNKSYFEFQQAEWDHFRNTRGSDGSSLNRLD
ncbi:MAG: hypothetical protein V4739_16465, partial [Pseudomonadota bacterium]